MRRRVTKKFLEKNDACKAGIGYWIEQKKPDLFEFIHQCKKDNHLDWANWLIVRCMDRKQYIAYAIYSAELVLPSFEKEFPEDKRPREAIEAAKKVLSRDTQKNREYAEYATWSIARSPRSAEYATEYAEYAADHAGHASMSAMLWQILEYGMSLMERKGEAKG